MNSIELKNMGLSELSHEVAADTNGGLFWLLVGLAADAAVIGSIAAAGAYVYGQAEAGYKQACGCQ
jgi:hypothetical protein